MISLKTPVVRSLHLAHNDDIELTPGRLPVYQQPVCPPEQVRLRVRRHGNHHYELVLSFAPVG